MNSGDIGEKNSHKKIPGLPSLNGLRCFEVAAREESFTRAAHQLHLTHGAVSRAIRMLENELSITLFERRNRRVFLTESGQILFRAVQQGFDVIGRAIYELHKQRNDASLVISCEPTLMMRWLIPRLSDFHLQHPEINIQLQAGGGAVSLTPGIDLAIRRNDFIWPPHYFSSFLFHERIGPVFRSTERARMIEISDQGTVQLRSDIKLLHTYTRADAWQNWAHLTASRLDGMDSHSYEHFYFSLQAAIAGLGVAIGSWYLVCDDFNSGILDAPFGFIEDGSAYYLLAPESFNDSSSQAKFYQWLCSQGESCFNLAVR
ncbi:LysR family transcriptional regulator [Budvicia aquatica]|uniref:LysR family transcriptional regulator n=1 Tax=Budvicia aquatica TaxID=82979 RepID=UPI0020873621|nr:LysR family transcriptional regulator [Budvicia aquatica]GKX50230.1 LysR family transcriptional regulator [Budvicia aquatica]